MRTAFIVVACIAVYGVVAHIVEASWDWHEGEHKPRADEQGVNRFNTTEISASHAAQRLARAQVDLSIWAGARGGF